MWCGARLQKTSCHKMHRQGRSDLIIYLDAKASLPLKSKAGESLLKGVPHELGSAVYIQLVHYVFPVKEDRGDFGALDLGNLLI